MDKILFEVFQNTSCSACMKFLLFFLFLFGWGGGVTDVISCFTSTHEINTESHEPGWFGVFLNKCFSETYF